MMISLTGIRICLDSLGQVCLIHIRLLLVFWSSFKSLRHCYHNLIRTSEKQYFSILVFAVSDNPRRLWQTVNKLLCHKSASPLPISTSLISLTDSFAFFFTDKITKLCPISTRTSPHLSAPLTTPPSFSTFNRVATGPGKS